MKQLPQSCWLRELSLSLFWRQAALCLGEAAAVHPGHMADDDERARVNPADELLGAVALTGRNDGEKHIQPCITK